jgi:CheY-like chemotaxis protein
MRTLPGMGPESTLAESLHCRRVLVAEDDRALLELLTEYLELQGLEVTAVASGDAALRELLEGPVPDLVLLDIRMPGIPGDEVLRRMRADPRLAQIPVAAITGLQPGEVELLANPDEFVSKPFDIESLAAAIQRMCSHRLS